MQEYEAPTVTRVGSIAETTNENNPNGGNLDFPFPVGTPGSDLLFSS